MAAIFIVVFVFKTIQFLYQVKRSVFFAIERSLFTLSRTDRNPYTKGPLFMEKNLRDVIKIYIT